MIRSFNKLTTIFVLCLLIMSGFGWQNTLPAQSSDTPSEFTEQENNMAAMVNRTFSRAVQAVRPSVVHIEVYKDSDSGPIYASRASGSGCIIDDRGFIITNNHVVEEADVIKVSLGDGRRFDVLNTYVDPDTDLAIVQIDPQNENLPFAQFGDSDKTQVGDFVLAIGSPFNLTQTVTSGIISYKGRQTRILGQWGYEDFIQTDADINKGNSGGPLVNLYGKIIGINSNIFSPTGVSAGYGFAVPSNIAKFVADQLIAQGKVNRGWLGIKMVGLDQLRKIKPEEFNYLGNSELGRFLNSNQKWFESIPEDIDGVVAFDVISGDPADKSGIKPRDIILGVKNRMFDNANDFRNYIATIPPGDPTTFKIWRNGDKIDLEVTLGDRAIAKLNTGSLENRIQRGLPEKAPRPQIPLPFERPDTTKPKLGVMVIGLTPDNANELGLSPSTQGVYISRVYEDSIAEKSGLQENDIIVSIDGQPVHTVEELKAILSNIDFSENSIEMTIKNEDGDRTVSVSDQ